MRVPIILSAALLLLVVLPPMAISQHTGVGLTYQQRSDVPTNGFGAQIERDFFDHTAILFLRGRIHVAYFSENNALDVTIGGQTSLEYGKVESVDFGVTALGGVRLGFLEPYIGLGIGVENWNQRFNDIALIIDDNPTKYYGVAGTSVTILPYIEPFIEYRVSAYDNMKEARKEISEGKSRFIVGLSIRF